MSLKIIETVAIRKLGCGFLFAFYSNFGACQGYVPLTLDVVRVALKVPLAFHTPL